MKLSRIIENINTLEKTPFLRLLEGFVDEDRVKEVDKILGKEVNLQNSESTEVSKIFSFYHNAYQTHVEEVVARIDGQLDVVLDILVRDGNCIMSRDWFLKLYEKEVKKLKVKSKNIDSDYVADLEESRIRDYKIYRSVLKEAYTNDRKRNQSESISWEERTLLNVLSEELGLGAEETKVINYSILPLQPIPVDDIIKEAKKEGLLFFSKRSNTIYVSDEMVRVFRRVRGKQLADKHLKRILVHLKDSQLNNACRVHGINTRQERASKIALLIEEGLNVSQLLEGDIWKDDVTKNERKAFVSELAKNVLKTSLKGASIEDKVTNLVKSFEELEMDDRLGISMEGFERLISELEAFSPKSVKQITEEYELEMPEISPSILIDYNIKPRDILYSFEEEFISEFCKTNNISTRGNEVENILKNYEDAEDLLIENYEALANRDLASLLEAGIKLKTEDVGVKFEDVTKAILNGLNLNVSEDLRKNISDKKNKLDIVIDLDKEGLIIVECKTAKDSTFKSYSSVKRQVLSYKTIAEKANYQVLKVIIVAPEFSDEFETEAGLDIDLNLSLIRAASLKRIFEAFRDSKHDKFPHNLFLRDVVIKEDLIIKALHKK